jgi:hypothetical protein
VPYNIIVTIQATFEAEVYEGAIALLHKCGRDRTIWVNVEGVAPAPKAVSGKGKAPAKALVAKPAKWVAQIVMAPCDSPEAVSKLIDAGAMDFTGGALYVVAHGSRNGPRAPIRGGKDLKPAGLTEMLHEVLQYLLHVPTKTRFEKLVLMVCNLGKMSKAESAGSAGSAGGDKADALVPPAYLPDVLKGMNPYSFDRIVAWNGWVTVFTFKHLAKLLVEYEDQILDEMRKLWRYFSKGYVMHASGLEGNLRKPMDPLQTFEPSMATAIAGRLKGVPLGALLRLVGQRMNEFDGLNTPKVLSSPFRFETKDGPDVIMHTRQEFDTSVETMQARKEQVMRKLELYLPFTVASVIAQYEGFGVWVYHPGKVKLCMYNPLVAVELGVTKV